MNFQSLRRRLSCTALAALSLVVSRAASAQTTFGTLSNFDVF